MIFLLFGVFSDCNRWMGYWKAGFGRWQQLWSLTMTQWTWSLQTGCPWPTSTTPLLYGTRAPRDTRSRGSCSGWRWQCHTHTFLWKRSFVLRLPQPFWNTGLANAFFSITHISLMKCMFFFHKLSYDFVTNSHHAGGQSLFMKIFLYIFRGEIVSCYFDFSISTCVGSWHCSICRKQADIIICKT